MRCTAKAKSTQERCAKHAMKGRNVCMFHGGKTKKGINHPNFKQGRYSKSSPDRLYEPYNASLSDKQRHDLRDEIALSEAMLDDLVGGIDSAASDALWLKLEEMVRESEELEGAELERANLGFRALAVVG
jgi:hypothetical protein